MPPDVVWAPEVPPAGRMVWHSQWSCPPSHIRLVPILQLGELGGGGGGLVHDEKHQALVGLDLTTFSVLGQMS